MCLSDPGGGGPATRKPPQGSNEVVTLARYKVVHWSTHLRSHYLTPMVVFWSPDLPRLSHGSSPSPGARLSAVIFSVEK